MRILGESFLILTNYVFRHLPDSEQSAAPFVLNTMPSTVNHHVVHFTV